MTEIEKNEYRKLGVPLKTDLEKLGYIIDPLGEGVSLEENNIEDIKMVNSNTIEIVTSKEDK